MQQTRQLRLISRPDGEVRESDFELETVPVPEPADKEFVVKVTDISIDPAMRGWMSDAPSYMPPVKLGGVMRALAVGRVTQSRHPVFAVGDWVHGTFGVQEYAVSNGEDVYKIHVSDKLKPATYLGTLGLTGLTAYFGLVNHDRKRPREMVENGSTSVVGS